ESSLSQVRGEQEDGSVTWDFTQERVWPMVYMCGLPPMAGLYPDAAHSRTGGYPLPLPWNANDLNGEAVCSLRALSAMSSWPNA
ncbi:thiamine pyridinylase, partial [Burkholderia pseudomallei]